MTIILPEACANTYAQHLLKQNETRIGLKSVIRMGLQLNSAPGRRTLTLRCLGTV